MFVFLCGAHCSGKTSMIKTFERIGFADNCGYEIGKEFFYRYNFAPEEQDEAFELKITNMELERDFLLQAKKGLSVVETWHPGNLAYVAVRNPKSFNRVAELMKKSPLLSSAFGIRLRTSYEEIFSRTKTFSGSREWAADFYSNIDNKLDMCIDALNLKNRVVNLNTNCELNVLTEKVKSIITNFSTCEFSSICDN